VWQAEGKFPFGNFGHCLGACCFKSLFIPPAVNIAASVIVAFYPPITAVVFPAALYPSYIPIANMIAVGACGSIMCFVTSGNRTSIRNKLNLKAEPCHDMIVHFCCMDCAVCQECRELKATHGGSTGGNHFNRM